MTKPAIPLGSNVFKIRFSPSQSNHGKDTSHSAIYIDFIKNSKIYLITVFSKSEESNITNSELKSIRNITNTLEGRKIK